MIVNGREYEVVQRDENKDNQYFPFNDEWFTYFINTKNSKIRKFHLDAGDECVAPLY